jgi:hypothetical protein
MTRMCAFAELSHQCKQCDSDHAAKSSILSDPLDSAAFADTISLHYTGRSLQT